jgi:hypothetical protein
MKVLAEDMHGLMQACFAGSMPLKLTSAPGAGKSKMAEAFAARMNELYADDGGYGCFIFDLSKSNVADAQGYLMPSTIVDTDVHGKTQEVLAAKYTYPYWAYDQITKKPAYKFKRGLIILEEWGQGELDTKKSLASLVNDRRQGLWDFAGFDILVLSNRPEDRSGVTREFDFLINRWCEAELVPTLEGFLVAGNLLGMTPLTLAFAARRSDALFNPVVPKEQGPWMTQRSLHNWDKVIKANAPRGLDIDSPLLHVIAEGTLGKADAAAYLAFAKARSKIPAVSAILSDPRGAPIPEELDVLMFLAFDLAAKTTRVNIAPIAIYVARLSSAMQVAYFTSASQRDDSLVMTAEFSAFAMSNVTLLSAAAARKIKK